MTRESGNSMVSMWLYDDDDDNDDDVSNVQLTDQRKLLSAMITTNFSKVHVPVYLISFDSNK